MNSYLDFWHADVSEFLPACQPFPVAYWPECNFQQLVDSFFEAFPPAFQSDCMFLLHKERGCVSFFTQRVMCTKHVQPKFCVLTPKDVFSDLRGGEREKKHWSVAFVRTPTGGQTCNLGMYPDQKSNPQSFGVWNDAPIVWATQPEQYWVLFCFKQLWNHKVINIKQCPLAEVGPVHWLTGEWAY